MLRPLFALLLPLFPLLACSTEPDVPKECERFTFSVAPEVSAPHVLCESSACGNGLNPPTAGPHCGYTLACRTYDAEQPPCVWLHNLEHGHAVFLYDCPEGCPEEIAKLEQARDAALVGSNGVRRALVTPASGLPQRVAAILWRRVYLTDSADPDALRCLLQFQDQDAPEPRLDCAP
ncbi:DUF3105 domain-containing protein [Hyalangium versicolor]|uniref:DUF3105 domain-containing protein n=1 Tax=Hyalangium versicolor TaxID=2861190 RepID=UPI001CCE049E|nr:DUF3105 domain-containing protein [Hyalangium versicolor]